MSRTIQRRPIRGGLAGLLLGLGATLMVIVYDLPVPGDVVLLGCILLGVLVGLFAPARRPKEGSTA